MPTCIERHGHTVDGQGFIHYDDRPITYEQADMIAGKRLDRRRNYAVINGAVHEAEHYTMACSGCYEGTHMDSAKGHGCNECGYTGRRRHGYWAPLGAFDDA